MQVTKLSSDCAMEHCHEVNKQTDEELQREYDFYMTKAIVDRMFSKGLISETEHKKLLEECKARYKPFLYELME